MKNSNLKFPCLIAAFYFGVSVQAQTTQDTVREQSIDEVVVIGYGTAKKRDLAGSIVKVDGQLVADKPSSNPVNALQGKVAGVSIVNSGQPGSQADVRIRGTVTINQTQPQYIVDGVFVNNIDFVNPNDIESMEILKDPSSLAIFGSRGANGAIIITTKRGRSGRTNVNLYSSVGVKSFDGRPDVTNGDQYRMLYNEDMVNQGLSPYAGFNMFNANTNWVDLITNKGAMVANHGVSISNGNDKNRVSFSFGYQTEEGSIKYEDYSRMTLKFNDDLKITDNIRAGVGFTGSFSKLPQIRSFGSALNATPVVEPINTIAGDYYGMYNSLPQELGAAQIANPLAFIEGQKHTQKDKEMQFNPNLYFEFDFLENFTFRSSFYGQFRQRNGRGYDPIFDLYVPETNSTTPFISRILTGVRQYENRTQSFQQDHLLTYRNRFGKHDLTAMAGFTSMYDDYYALSASARGSLSSPLGQIPYNPRFWYISSDYVDSTTKEVNSAQNKATQTAVLGRILYNYDNKYILNGSIRNDASSRLSPSNRNQMFWSLGAAWEVTRESFMDNQTVFDLLKLKGSIGTLGNQFVPGNYLYYPTYQEGGTGVFNGFLYPAFIKAFEENENLKWEEIESYEVGLESMMVGRKLSFDATYYNKQTNDLLTYVQGTTSFFTNAGSIQSNGFEFTAGWKDRISDNFNYYLNANLTTTNTEVLSVFEDGYEVFSGPAIFRKGAPVGAFYGYVVDGVYQSYADILASPPTTIGDVGPGDLKYRDINGDGSITPDDRTIIGDPTPDFTYGFSVGGDYKGFYMNADFFGVYGNEVFRTWGNGNSFAPFNYRTERLDRWTGPGTSNWEPRSYSKSAYNRENSTYMIEDGSFFRIRNVQLGYNFNRDLIEGLNIQALKVYFNVQNLKTWDHVNGFTPESGGSALQFGVNGSGYPNPRVTSFGVNVTF